MHFTGKERDSESGLDNFGARYDSSNLGRFMSPDPYNAGAFLDGPQTWNAYSYVLNNPLNAVDPNGLDCVYTGDAEGNPNAGRVTIIHGDCINAGGKDDGGVFVDNDENHPVQNSDVILSSDGSVGLVSYTRTDGFTTGYGCLGNCSSDSVQVTAASPDQPTATIGPQTNWFFTRQAGCVLPGLKGFMGGLILKKDIDAALSPILGPPPGGYEGTGMGTASVAAEEGLKHVAENRPFLNTVKAALKEEGHRVSANALARGARFLSRAAVVTHVAFAANDGREDYNACMQ
jgi:RHS repeat-associated protein